MSNHKNNHIGTLNKKIGIIGSGVVGQVLGTAFLVEGYEVMLGSRDALKAELIKWKAINEKGLIGTFINTANFADIIVLSTNGSVTINAIELADRNNFDEKVVIYYQSRCRCTTGKWSTAILHYSQQLVDGGNTGNYSCRTSGESF